MMRGFEFSAFPVSAQIAFIETAKSVHVTKVNFEHDGHELSLLSLDDYSQTRISIEQFLDVAFFLKKIFAAERLDFKIHRLINFLRWFQSNCYGKFKKKNPQIKMRQYQELLKHVLANGTRHEDRTGVGTISVFGYQTRFDLREGFPIVTTKRVPFRWIAEELFWFLSGDTNEKNLRARGVDIWAEWADEEHTRRFGRAEGDLGPIYGYLWRSFGGDYPELNGVDQIGALIEQIEKNPNSRRLIVSGWNPATADKVDLPPCHTLFQFKIESEKILHCQLYQRSADAFLGVPFNISSYALLMQMIAHVCRLEVGEFIHTFGDLHIYRNHLEQVEELLKREPLPLPKLEFVNAANLKGFPGLLDFRYENLNLVGYQSHGKIAAPVAV
jgi:thymidylate synthase